jgi:hypothetical protein
LKSQIPAHQPDEGDANDSAKKKEETIVIKMNSKIGVCLQLGVLLVAGALAASASARPAERHNATPFRGRFEGTSTSTPGPFPFIDVIFVATGNATQLGQYTLTQPQLVNLVAGTAYGTYHFVAANGDTLTAEGPSSARPGESPGVLLITETATITGGTGRFVGATGTFTTEGVLDTATGISAGSFSGTISLRHGGDQGDDD